MKTNSELKSGSQKPKNLFFTLIKVAFFVILLLVIWAQNNYYSTKSNSLKATIHEVRNESLYFDARTYTYVIWFINENKPKELKKFLSERFNTIADSVNKCGFIDICYEGHDSHIRKFKKLREEYESI